VGAKGISLLRKCGKKAKLGSKTLIYLKVGILLLAFATYGVKRMGMFGAIGKLFFGDSGNARKAQIESDLTQLAKAKTKQHDEFDWAKNGLTAETWYDRKITIDRIAKSGMETPKKVQYLRLASADQHWLNRKAVLSALRGLKGKEVEGLLDDIASGDNNINIRKDAKKMLIGLRKE